MAAAGVRIVARSSPLRKGIFERPVRVGKPDFAGLTFGTTQMDDSKGPSNRVVDLDDLLARLETRISKLMIRALTQPGYNDEIEGLVLVRDDLRDRQRRAVEHPGQPRSD
jgi:hypothetical protein